jgi:predicted RNase H-like HicB family nuclease
LALRTYRFNVIIEPDQDADGNAAWHAYCPALVEIGAATSGRTKGEALRNLNEVVQMIVQELAEDGLPIPGGPAEQVQVTEIPEDSPSIAITA